MSAVTEKLMMYALGRNVQYYDAPAIRAVVRAAAANNYEFSGLVEGIVASVPFQMRDGPGGRVRHSALIQPWTRSWLASDPEGSDPQARPRTIARFRLS